MSGDAVEKQLSLREVAQTIAGNILTSNLNIIAGIESAIREAAVDELMARGYGLINITKAVSVERSFYQFVVRVSVSALGAKEDFSMNLRMVSHMLPYRFTANEDKYSVKVSDLEKHDFIEFVLAD